MNHKIRDQDKLSNQQSAINNQFLNLTHGRNSLEVKLGLDRIKACLEYLGNPQEKFKSAIIGGTNGKGSVTYYLSNLACKYTNYKVGRYISPHLISWNERFVINEKIYPAEELKYFSEDTTHKIRDFENKTNSERKLTEFEILTIIAFSLFAKENVDIAFLEIGMGGRLDAVNVVSSSNTLCSVITTVSLDHMNYLGDSIEEIAYEKAGIIKEANFIITGASDAALEIIKQNAIKSNAILITSDLKNYYYQDKNIEIALSAWDVISRQLNISTTKKNTKNFLKTLCFPGRYQFINDRKILLDGAHNPQAAIELKKLIERDFSNKRIVFIIGMLDKDYKSFLSNLLLENSYVICTEPKSNRATDKTLLARYANSILSKSKTSISNNLDESILIAKRMKHDLIVITGSLYLAGEALKILKYNVT